MSGAEAAFDALDRAGVRWCLWRGTPRIGEALKGRSDFDLLVDPGDLEPLAGALGGVGFRRARTAPVRTAAGLEDWLGLAGPRGPLLHLHVHARMLVGEPRLYRYRLPFEAEVLERRRTLPSAPGLGAPKAADSTDEAALLLIRAALQVRARDRLPRGRALGKLRTKVERDLEALLAHTDRAAVRDRVERWLGAGSAEGLELPRVRRAHLLRLRGLARRELAAHTDQTDAAAFFAGLVRLFEAARRRSARGGRGPLPMATRSGPRGGASVALRGPGAEAAADGLRELFGSKLDTLRLPGSDSPRARRARAHRARERGWLALWTTQDRVDGPRADELVIELGAGAGPQPTAEVVAAVWERI